MRAAFALGAALLLGAAGFASAAPWGVSRSGAKPKQTVVRVVARDFSFALSRRSVPLGRVRFVVVNRGTVGHDFEIAGRKTPVLRPGKSAALVVVFKRPGAYRYVCTVPGHAALGMKGVLTVGKAASPTSTATRPATTAASTTTTVAEAPLKLTKIGDFGRSTYVTAPPGDSTHLFLVEQAGKIEEVVGGKASLFLDLTDKVEEVSERGLLGMAFAPDYAKSGLFYVDYTDRVGNGNVNVVEYRRSAVNPDVADPSTARPILHIVEPYENHNAGMLQFGPDGYLYVSVGDGDSGVINPPGAFAQTLDDLLGNVLRIDPLHPSGGLPYSIPDTNPFVGKDGTRGEIWDYGLRNPWRFWIDAETGDIYIGDVGLGGPEEIDYDGGNRGGRNFGWPCFQGTDVFDKTKTCADPVAPVYEYDHGQNRCAVIGGVVVRDERLAGYDGRYLLGDYCGGQIYSLLVVDGKATDVQDTGLSLSTLSSFGVDGSGRVYVVDTDGGLYRIDPAS